LENLLQELSLLETAGSDSSLLFSLEITSRQSVGMGEPQAFHNPQKQFPLLAI
jgi:hypothetical protein